jgi:hypothetical protein
MSKQRRESARTKIDSAIQSAVNQEADSEDAQITQDALEGIADVVFGIWTSLDQISAAINQTRQVSDE